MESANNSFLKKNWLKITVAAVLVISIIVIGFITILPDAKPKPEQKSPPEEKVGKEADQQDIPTKEKDEAMYEFYPDTEEAPNLEFYWGKDKKSTPKNITRVTPYGAWEDWTDTKQGVLYEPAVEMQFYAADGPSPVYSAAAGTIITVERDYKTKGYTSGFVTMRYGKNYGIHYAHVVDIPKEITPGAKIESGTLIGYGERRPLPHDPSIIETWWEIELDVKKGSVFRSLPPYDYFSQNSKKELQSILSSSQEWSVIGSSKTWTVKTGCSWVKYFSKPEFWTTPERVGYFTTAETETLNDFLKASKLTWKEGDQQGRVLGPKDKCR